MTDTLIASPERPVAHAERHLLAAILNGTYGPRSVLPAERELAALLGVTRPTLREALQRLARDGWIVIRQGKPTVVTDFWREGGMNILSTLVSHGEHLPRGFVVQLLEVRAVLAPAYGRASVEHNPAAVVAALQPYASLADIPESYAAFDWGLHHALTVAAGNPIFTLILNGFASFYEAMAARYFATSYARERSRLFYQQLLVAAQAHDASLAETLCRDVARESIAIWQQSE